MIDTRAAGGYVVGPGSTTPDGVYRFTDDRAPANLPAWLVQALTPKPRTAISAPVVVRSERLPAYIDAALRGERDRVAATQPGTHNKTLFVAAVALGRHVGEDHLPSTTAQALTNAVHARRPRPEPGVIFHSDSEYVGAGDLDVRLPVGVHRYRWPWRPRRCATRPCQPRRRSTDICSGRSRGVVRPLCDHNRAKRHQRVYLER
jgi:hypothetical protein